MHFLFDQPARLLVADDDPILREFAQVHLTSPQVEVVTVADGMEALQRLALGGVDLALVDLEMPRMDGFALTAALRQDAATAHLPIMVITGREDIAAIDRAFALGATAFVVKPINWRLITHQILYVLRNSRAEAQVRAAHELARRADDLKMNLLRVVSHELRTPAALIRGFAQEAQRAAAQGEPVAETLASLDAEAAALLSLVRDAKVASQALSGAIEARRHGIGVRRLLRQPLELALRQTGAARARLEARDRTGDHEVAIDPGQVEVALRHLVANSLLHGAGKVRVEAQLDPDGALIVSVSDEGPGFDAQVLEAAGAFCGAEKALSKTKRGFGLGLEIAARVGAVHGGGLMLENMPAGGACARLRLADAAQPIAAAALAR